MPSTQAAGGISRPVQVHCPAPYHPVFRRLFVLPSLPMPALFTFEEDDRGARATALIRRSSGSAKEQALQAALDRFAPGRLLDPPDAPDGWVTAVRAIPARPAVHASWPEFIDPRLRAALETRGVTEL
jgi:hypothetical protein